MGYRDNFIRKYPGVRRVGMGGYWYRCAICGKWCGRPGREQAYIPDNMKMEVDHIRPWSQGGSDEVWNLQATCKPCNRGKLASMSGMDELKSVKNAVVHPVDTFVSTPLRKAARQNKLLKALGITKRK
jgi:5-methylcytosine-specific restriction endonuclease McrA